MQNVFSSLNEAQREAVLHRDGPMVVFSGAGSGKTRIITARIANLIRGGVAPWQILAVTFTNKAAREMRERAEALYPDAARCSIATFHSICARWLRESAGILGFSPNFLIYDDSDSASALKKIVKENLQGVDLGAVLPDMKQFIHHVKMLGLLPSEVANSSYARDAKIPAGGVEVYRLYQEYLARCDAMDFDDLILNILLLLRRHKEFKQSLQKRYRYVMVDEFQDTNRSQLELIAHIVEEHRNIMVVGDDDQSIYSWRGATPHHLIDFEKFFPGAQRVLMTQNYRSTQNIIEAANAVIAHNVKRVEKKLFSEVLPGEAIELRIEADGAMEAWYAVETIKRELIHYHYSDFALFYRTNAQSRLLEEALLREQIPYQIFGGLRFYERMEVKDIVAYLRLLANADDDVSFMRIVNTPARGIGQKTVDDLAAFARTRNVSLSKALKIYGEERKDKSAVKLSIFSTIMQSLRESQQVLSLGELVAKIIEVIDYVGYLQKKYPMQVQDKLENVHELRRALTSYAEETESPNLADWLQSISLGREEEGDGVEQGVALMTLHMAKGLEFKRVIITGVEEGILPHRNSSDAQDDLEEERRLFYVGITRAREKLSLLCAAERLTYDARVANQPSRFLDEIPKHLMVGTSYFGPLDTIASAQVNDSGAVHYDYDEDESLYGSGRSIVGQKVRHPTYGVGRVTALEKERGRLRAVVDFREFGVRMVAVEHLE